MRQHLQVSLFAGVCATLLLAASPSESAVTVTAGANEVSSDFSGVQTASHTTQAKQCVKWTRRWNTRHGFGHRRCVQWR